MLAGMSRGVRLALGAVALAVLLAPGRACAQGRCGQHQGRSLRTTLMRPNLPTQLYSTPPYAALIALRQLQQQQLAALPAPQNAQLVGLPRPPQNAGPAAQPVLQANPPAAQLRAQPPADRDQPPPPPEDPEATAARRLRLARQLAADAETAGQQGERDRAARIRQRVVDRLHDIITRYPETKAADAAGELLEKLAP